MEVGLSGMVKPLSRMSQNGQTHLKNLAANDFYRTPPVPAFLLYFPVCAGTLVYM